MGRVASHWRFALRRLPPLALLACSLRKASVLPRTLAFTAGGARLTGFPRPSRGGMAAEHGAKRARVNGSEKKSMTPEEKFFFDLNGFLVVRGALTQDEVAAMNAAIDAHAGDVRERTGEEVRNTRAGTPLRGDGKNGRRDLGGMLSWAKPHCDVFRSLMCHENLLHYITELCGEGYRMDHLPFAILQSKGSEGFHLHGGPRTSSGKLNLVLQYRCDNGEFFNTLLAMSVQLSDHNPGDGGFCVVRGSHKINFAVPDAFMHGESGKEHWYQPPTKAGDVVFFSEATVHGAMPWTAEHERRIALYRFAPATFAYGRSYSPQWPAPMLEGLTPQQRAVLEPPYANRLDRPVLKAEAPDVVVQSRSDEKKAFDREVFKTNYF